MLSHTPLSSQAGRESRLELTYLLGALFRIVPD
jgi:hypothetical protein